MILAILVAGIRLLVAAQNGDLDYLRKLVADGLSVNSTNFDSVTPLHEACLVGQLSCVRLLLELGANVSHGCKLFSLFKGMVIIHLQ